MEAIKNKNIKYLASPGINVPKHVPLIESLKEVSPRSASDVAGRLCAMTYVIGFGLGANGSDLMVLLKQY